MEVEEESEEQSELEKESEELSDVEEESEELHEKSSKRMCHKRELREMELESRAPAVSVERVSHVKEA